MSTLFPSSLQDYTLILASGSPRRAELIRGLHLNCVVRPLPDVDESFPAHLSGHEITLYLARMKAAAYPHDLLPREILITADTIVWHRGRVLGKPVGREEALDMLRALSGDEHRVYTGVFLRHGNEVHEFSVESKVCFRALTEDEMTYYVDTFRPYDKAGAYGIQEWIGYVGVERIEGSYFNVMGLPVQKLYEALNHLILQKHERAEHP